MELQPLTVPYLRKLEVHSLGIETVQVPDERERPRAGRKIRGNSVLQVISQQDKDTQENANTEAVEPSQAQDT